MRTLRILNSRTERAKVGLSLGDMEFAGGEWRYLELGEKSLMMRGQILSVSRRLKTFSCGEVQEKNEKRGENFDVHCFIGLRDIYGRSKKKVEQ